MSDLVSVLGEPHEKASIRINVEHHEVDRMLTEKGREAWQAGVEADA